MRRELEGVTLILSLDVARAVAVQQQPDAPTERGGYNASTNSSVDDKRMTAQPHLLLTSVRAALADDEAPKTFVSRRPIHLTLLIVSPFCHLPPH